jgi:hypothetical protein
MARSLAALAGVATLLVALLTFAGSSAALAKPDKAPVFEGWYKTEALCESAGGEYGYPYTCLDVPTHKPDPWALYVDFIIPPP